MFSPRVQQTIRALGCLVIQRTGQVLPVARSRPTAKISMGVPVLVLLEVVKLVLEAEGLGDAGDDAVVRGDDGDFKFAVAVVAGGSAADQDAVVFRPVAPVAPEGGMDQEQAMAASCSAKAKIPFCRSRLLRGWLQIWSAGPSI